MKFLIQAVLVFQFEDALTYSTSSRFRDSCVVDDVAVASQVEDVQRTWRLVSDLEVSSSTRINAFNFFICFSIQK